MLITCRHDKRDGNFGEQRRPSAPREILGYVESEPVRCGGKGVGCGNVGQSAIGVSCSAADNNRASRVDALEQHSDARGGLAKRCVEDVCAESAHSLPMISFPRRRFVI